MNYNPRSLSSPVSSIIFDFGGVLGLPQDAGRVSRMASLCRLSIEEFSPLYMRDRLELDRGTLSCQEYWARILRESGVPPTSALVAQINDLDSQAWLRINSRVVGWSVELRSAGFFTAILSNMAADKLAHMRGLPEFDWIKDFPVTVFSCEHHLVKPEPAIYRRCLDLMGKEPEDCLLLDDSLANIQGGRAAGISALHFRSAEEAAPLLSSAWALPVRTLIDGTAVNSRD
jgi:FMN phosphatase YigB (HAD superfamily)